MSNIVPPLATIAWSAALVYPALALVLLSNPAPTNALNPKESPLLKGDPLGEYIAYASVPSGNKSIATPKPSELTKLKVVALSIAPTIATVLSVVL